MSELPGPREIEENYNKEEEIIKNKLKKCEAQRDAMTPKCSSGLKNLHKSMIPTDAVAEARNAHFLKELEISKARLRTLTSFSPTDQELRERIIHYRTVLK